MSEDWSTKKKALDLVRMSLISPEMAFCVIVLAVSMVRPQWLQVLGSRIQGSELNTGNPFLWVAATGLASSVWLGMKVLEPPDAPEFFQASTYHGFRTRVVFSVVVAGIGSLVAFFVAAFPTAMEAGLVGGAYLAPVGGGWIACLSLFLANTKLRQVLQK